jgi:asparagine synthase (glutamine-hydrolysing)
MTQGFFGSGLDKTASPAFAHMLRLQTTRRVLAFFRPEWRQRLEAFDAEAALAATLPADFARWPALARDQYVEANTLMSGYLLSSQGDRMAMAASIEARFPFLDHRVLEFSCRLPVRLKLCGLKEKVLLRRAFAAELPPSIGQRTKQPYRAPDSACFFEGGRLRDDTAALLDRTSLDDAGLFDPVAVGKLVDKCAAGRAIGFGDNMAFVGIVSTMSLHRQLVRGEAA